MPGLIRDEDIALVRERADIVEVVGQYVALRNAGGGSMKGLCPFHDEKTPSFNVNGPRGFFHCFGCGVGGDVIRFVMDLEHLSFVEAVERLATRAGIELRYENAGPAPAHRGGQRARLVAAHVAAAEFYAEQLAAAGDARPARDFLHARGFDQATAQAYGCGYAPRDWDALTKHLRGRGFTDAELVTGGLAREGQRGLIDRFVGRLLWPIRDITGDVIGFGARRIHDDDRVEAKYLNTPDTPIYKKGQVLYGVDLAKREIARRHQAVVVEGYTDVMACHLAGVPTAIATCGTAFGTEHIKVLRRLLLDNDEFGGEVIFTFDGDEAGQKAALRAFEDDQRFVAQTFVAVEPSGLDPCELRQAKGDVAVRDLVARRTPLFEFAVRTVLSRHDLDTTEGRLAALDAAAPIVARIRDVGLRQRYAVNLDRWLGLLDERFVLRRVTEQAARAEQQQRRGGRQPEEPAAPVRRGRQGVERPRPDDSSLAAEREALKVALQIPVLAGPLFDAVDDTAYTHPAYAALRRAVAEAGGASAGTAGAAWPEKVAAGCPDELSRSLVPELSVEALRAPGPPDTRYAAAVVTRLQELAVSRQIATLKSKLQRLNPVEDPEKHTRLFSELISLEQYKRGLRDQVVGGL